jgi:mono/diheme cytochrome c family protein
MWLKRLSAAAALLVLACFAWAQTTAGPTGATLYGDLNGDGKIGLADVILSLRVTVGALKPEDIQRAGLPGGAATPTQIQHGRYLVIGGGCADCHNRGPDNPSDPNWLAGSLTDGDQGTFQIGPFKTHAANLTPDPETGLGKWTPEQIFTALRTGKDSGGMYLCPPMPWPAIRNLSDQDLWSIVAYLRSVKPVVNKVPEPQGPNPDASGHGDWSSAYKDLPPPFPPYPGTNETQ